MKILWAGNAKDRMKDEIKRLSRLNLEETANMRWNVTLRWVRLHFDERCPVHKQQDGSAVRSEEALRSTFQSMGPQTSAVAAAASSATPPPWDRAAASRTLKLAQDKVVAQACYDPHSASLQARQQMAAAMQPAEPEVVGDGSGATSTGADDDPGPRSAVGDPSSRRSTVGDQQGDSSAVAQLFEMLHFVTAMVLPESFQKGAELFTGCSTVRILV